MKTNHIYEGDSLEVLKTLPDESINCVVTSPPYWGLRDYGVEGQFGLEKTPEEYVEKLVKIFREVRRVLRDDGTVWLNLGDSYAGSSGSGGKTEKQVSNVGSFHGGGVRMSDGLKPKDLVGIPWRVAFALQADGWYLRSDIIWHKPNPMPESVTDRPTKSHEYIFLLSKSKKYYYDVEAIREPHISSQKEIDRQHSEGIKDTNYATSKNWSGGVGYNENGRNKRTVWTVNTKPYPEAHFAVFPEDLIVPCIKAGCPKDGIVLDPFIGSGTTAKVAQRLGRNWVGIELNPDYIKLANKRFIQEEIF